MNKTELLAALEIEREKFLDAIEGIPEEAMIEPGVNGEWSLKDLLSHLTRWEAEMVRGLWQTKQGQVPDWPDGSKVDEINAQWHTEMRDRPLIKALDDFEAVRSQTLLRVEAFTDRELTDPKRYPWTRGTPLWEIIANNSFGHEEEHLPDIVTWRKKRQI